MPADLPPRIVELARKWTEELTSAGAKAAAIQDHLRKDFSYDLASPSQGKPQPLDHFLFDSKRGHCEFFSSAMAVMLRAVGIPSRNVTGFVGGTWNSFGHYYSVRQGDAHSWVEAYIEDGPRPGWVTFDPTPAGAQPFTEPHPRFYYELRDALEALSQDWNRYVVGYDLHKQGRLIDEVSQSYQRLRSRTGLRFGSWPSAGRSGLIVALLFLLGIVAAYVVVRRRQQRANGRDPGRGRNPDARLESAVALYRSLEIALQHHGITRAPSLPPLRHAEQLRERSHPLADEVHALTTRYLEARFGGHELTDTSRREFERKVREIRAFRAPPP
jgi:hypothetical protein